MDYKSFANNCTKTLREIYRLGSCTIIKKIFYVKLPELSNICAKAPSARNSPAINNSDSRKYSECTKLYSGFMFQQ